MEEEYTIELTEQDVIKVRFFLHQGRVLKFVVRLVSKIDGQRYEILRFDTVHDRPHMDILDIKGKLYDKIWYDVDNNWALTMAIQDIRANYEAYRERFIKWLADRR